MAKPIFRPVLGRRQGLLLGGALLATPFIPRARAEDPIHVGLSAALTGPFAQNGVWMQNGVKLAMKEINDAGGINGRPLQIFVADDQGTNPTAAGNAVNKLLTESQVKVMIGPHNTPALLPNLLVLAQAKVPVLSGASGPIITQQGNPWVFRVSLNDAAGAALLVGFVMDTLGWKKIGINYVNTAFGQGGMGAVKAALTARNVEPAALQSHLTTTKDMTSQVLAFKNAEVDGVIMWSDDEPAGLFTKQAKTLGAHFGVAGSAGLAQPSFIKLASDAAEDVYAIVAWSAENPAPAVVAYKAKYQAAYGQPPELFASTYYDALHLAARAMRAAPEISGPAIQQALTQTKAVPGVLATYNWTSTGDMIQSGLITRVKDGKPGVVKVVTS
jgi:branched-chain amino acid transport system substrate-binding protein